MPKIIIFSRTYPSYHPKAGQPTYFVEKVLKSLYPNHTYYPVSCKKCGWISMSCCALGGGQIADTGDYDDIYCPVCNSTKLDGDTGVLKDLDRYYMSDCGSPKHHTIRSGHRFKVGDKFSPRVWSGTPYRSKMIQFAPDIEVKKTWDFDAEGTDFFLSGKHEITHPEGFDFSEVEKNDGLPPGDLFDWICDSPKFKKSNRFTGQIICWNFDIEY